MATEQEDDHVFLTGPCAVNHVAHALPQTSNTDEATNSHDNALSVAPALMTINPFNPYICPITRVRRCL